MENNTEKMNIALCMNSKYVMPSMVCIVSILENNTRPIDFYILYSFLEQKEIDFMTEKIASYGDKHRLIPVKIDEKTFADSPAPGRSKEAYFRLLIPTVLPQTVDKCLYMDSDVLVQGKLDGFYDISFEGKALVVCQDVGELLYFHKERHELLGIPKECSYFNSGVLLVNLTYFRESFEIKKFFDYIEANADKLKFLDQDVLNALMYNKVVFADPSLYDYMEILVSHLLANDNMEKAIMVHFLQKPWKYTYNGINSGYWWKYARKVYPVKYIVFVIINLVYRKCLSLVLFVVSIQNLKRIRRALKKG